MLPPFADDNDDNLRASCFEALALVNILRSLKSTKMSISICKQIFLCILGSVIYNYTERSAFLKIDPKIALPKIFNLIKEAFDLTGQTKRAKFLLAKKACDLFKLCSHPGFKLLFVPKLEYKQFSEFNRQMQEKVIDSVDFYGNDRFIDFYSRMRDFGFGYDFLQAANTLNNIQIIKADSVAGNLLLIKDHTFFV